MRLAWTSSGSGLPAAKHRSRLGVILFLASLPMGQALADEDANFPMPPDPLYVSECGSCHTAYAPGLLPARSWRRMMDELEHHFGSDAALPEPQRLAILNALVDHAADAAVATPLMRRIAGSIHPGAAPQHIVETPFFKYMHDEVPQSFWRRPRIKNPANCGACHPRADEGRYGEREVRIPK